MNFVTPDIGIHDIVDSFDSQRSRRAAIAVHACAVFDLHVTAEHMRLDGDDC